MDIRVLRYFLAVAREGNVTRAAKSLHLAQPSLSRQLMNLEEELGKQLFVRTKRGITLTEEGILLRKRAEEIAALLKKTEEELTQEPETLHGEISIGGGQSGLVLKAVENLRKRHPGIRLRQVYGDATEVRELLDHGSLTFCILLEPVDSEKYEFLSLPETDEWGLLMLRDDPLAQKNVLTTEDIRGIPLILPQRPELQKKIAGWVNAAPEELNIAATFNFIYCGLAQYVQSGLGKILMFRSQADFIRTRNLCFRPLGSAETVRHCIAWKRFPVFSALSRRFLEELKSLL